MSEGKKFFKSLKALYFVSCLFMLMVITLVMLDSIYHQSWGKFFVFICAIVVVALPIAVFIYVYYLNVAVEIKVDNQKVEIITNKKSYYYQINQILKITKDAGKIYIYCDDKRYVYQTVYFFREKLPDIDILKSELVMTEFNGFN